jgi:hypothetical protein
MSLRKVGSYKTYTASYPRRRHSSVAITMKSNVNATLDTQRHLTLADIIIRPPVSVGRVVIYKEF